MRSYNDPTSPWGEGKQGEKRGRGRVEVSTRVIFTGHDSHPLYIVHRVDNKSTMGAPILNQHCMCSKVTYSIFSK